MFKLLFVLFVIVPIIEIFVLMQVGAVLGAWPTIAIVIATAWLGAKHVRQQGLATMQSVQNKMAVGEMPSEDIVTGLLLLVAGVLLVTPGFVTDFFGLSLLVPSVRKGLIASVQQHLSTSATQSGSVFFHHQQSHTSHQSFEQKEVFSKQSKSNGDVIEGEFERKD
ncbi:FxsA family protein [Thalassotalea fusca]